MKQKMLLSSAIACGLFYSSDVLGDVNSKDNFFYRYLGSYIAKPVMSRKGYDSKVNLKRGKNQYRAFLFLKNKKESKRPFNKIEEKLKLETISEEGSVLEKQSTFFLQNGIGKKCSELPAILESVKEKKKRLGSKETFCEYLKRKNSNKNVNSFQSSLKKLGAEKKNLSPCETSKGARQKQIIGECYKIGNNKMPEKQAENKVANGNSVRRRYLNNKKNRKN